MKKNILIMMLASFVGLVSASCGSGEKKIESVPVVEDVEVRKSQLEQALTSGDLKNASVVADSMSLFVDDFTPEQTVQVLTAFVSLHNDASTRHESRRDLETLRKYVDVYDIALSVNPKDTRAAFKKAKRKNPSLDFDSIAKVFREKLVQYDSMQDGSPATAAASAAVADTIGEMPDSVQQPKELPVELRPAM